MEPRDLEDAPQRISLEKGGQVYVNGAVVTAREACSLEVGSGAFVMTGSALARDPGRLRNPREELYFSILDVGTDPVRFSEARFRLFRLLSHVVAEDRTHYGQQECANCAAALLAGKVDEAAQSAARIASMRLERSAQASPNPTEALSDHDHRRRQSVFKRFKAKP